MNMNPMVFLIMMVTPAIALGSEGDCRGNQPCNDNNVEIDVVSDNSSNSTSSADSSSQSGSESVSSSNNSVTITETHPSSIKLRNVASPDTPNPYPTAPCRVGVSGGLSVAGFAGSGGGSVEDTECTLRETARSFKDLGVPEVGLYLLCTQSEVVLGRFDKKGKREKGQHDSLGAAECLRLVREFQGDTDEPVISRGEIEDLRRQLAILQDEVGQHEVAQEAIELEVAQVREIRSRPAPRPAAPPQQIIQQEYLTPDKRAKLSALIEEEIIVIGDEE